MPTKLGRELADARRKGGWTLRAVEDETGIHNAHLSQIESGTIERPDPNILWSLAALYGLKFEDLMRLAGHVERDGPGKKRRSLVGAALYALDDLDAKEQKEVLEFMAEIKRKRACD